MKRSQINLDQGMALNSSKSILFSSPQSANLDVEDSNSISANTLMHVDSRFIAEQLTYLDKRLFQCIFAYHCLASVWGTRYQKSSANSTMTTSSTQQNQHKKTSSNSSAPELTQSTSSTTMTPNLSGKFASMRAFIDQFNRVSFVVQVFSNL